MTKCGSLCFIIFRLLACVSAAWRLGGDGESCSVACASIGQQCIESALLAHNSDVSKEGQNRNASIANTIWNCTKFNSKFGRNADVPAYEASTGNCYLSATDRVLSEFKCDRSTNVGKQRLCWCQAEDSIAKHNETLKAADRASESESAGYFGLSDKLIVVLLSCALLCIGCIGMGFGIVRRLRKQQLGIPENQKPRPTDNGYYVRCANCGCPVGESRSVNAMGYGYSDGTKSAHSKRSSRSRSQKPEPRVYTHCPACRKPLPDASQNTKEVDVTQTAQFRPGGVFITESMDDLKMGDESRKLNSPTARDDVKMGDAATPKATRSSALRSFCKAQTGVKLDCEADMHLDKLTALV